MIFFIVCLILSSQEAKEKMLQIMNQVEQQQLNESERRLKVFADKEAEECNPILLLLISYIYI